MSNLPKRRYLPFLLQALLWTALAVFMLLYLPLVMEITLPLQFWFRQLIIFILLICVYYINALVFVPQMLLKSRNGVFVLFVFILAFAFIAVVRLCDIWFDVPQLMEKALKLTARPGAPRPDRFFDPLAVIILLLILGISTSVTLIQKWQEDNQSRILLEQEKISSELAYLKSQINPHFFFNTLNNIYALMHIDIESSKIALHKLSRMMRYLLYETQNEYTMLSRELAFITDFIELMKLRLSKNIEVIYKETELTDDFKVNPMLFLPLIENAFKHGVEASQNSYIGIIIEVKENVVQMEVKNRFFKKSSEQGRGIGLNNTKRRLDLLYPGKHKFSTTMDFAEGVYIASLKIELS